MNKNVEKVQISGIRKFYNEVVKVDGAISLTLGQPDFKTPEAIKIGMKEAIDKDLTTYTSNAGIEPLREEIGKYLNGFGINYSKEEICLTVGGSEGIFIVLQSLINPGEKVLIPNPAYPAYESIVNIIGGEVANYKLNPDFTVNVENIKKGLDETGAKVLILSFPTNPTGAILDEKGRDELVELIKERDILVITDEIYASVIYDKYVSVAQNEEILEKIIYISGFSKMFSATGLRLGYVCAKAEIMKEIMKVHQYGVSCAPSIVQYGVLKGLRESLGEVEKMKEEFKKRKIYVIDRLKKMGIETVDPKGAFYIFPNIEKFKMTSEEFCLSLLKEEKVACVPGTAFGTLGEGYMRISYCYSIDELKEALDRIEKFIKKKSNI
ncbi:aminotransferase class I/II-fold pyridoxal phosphate-dependent enzyme [uncultured Clostridium sp.]|uniref:pyridoxal phosphate-dependent aminotransferase n=1 Tax=uncultured Clostridium sp. TaxID=59620 RepID=UPI00262D3D8B|nr:aminotransferase class I/II-fold pyridoxal phosphate-dependent enzyme [uncultured Clostridium sp.]